LCRDEALAKSGLSRLQVNFGIDPVPAIRERDTKPLASQQHEEHQRIETEISYFFHAKGGIESLHPLRHLVWCKLSYVLGFTHPTGTPFDAATELALQKASFDYFWSRSLTEIITTVGGASPGNAADFEALAGRLTKPAPCMQVSCEVSRRGMRARRRPFCPAPTPVVGTVEVSRSDFLARGR
jgi:hypothetical protein